MAYVLLLGIQVIDLSLGQQCPKLPGIFVGNGDQGLVIAHPHIQTDDPLLHPVLFIRCFLAWPVVWNTRLYREAAQIRITASADAPSYILPPLEYCHEIYIFTS